MRKNPLNLNPYARIINALHLYLHNYQEIDINTYISVHSGRKLRGHWLSVREDAFSRWSGYSGDVTDPVGITRWSFSKEEIRDRNMSLVSHLITYYNHCP